MARWGSKRCVCIMALTLSCVFILGFIAQLRMTVLTGSFEPGVLSYFREFTMEENVSLHLYGNESLEGLAHSVRSAVVTQKKPRKYNVLINSYMNSGSRFTGSLFGFRSDAFYFYEPLWRFSVWNYYHRPDQVCNSIDGPATCSKITVEALNRFTERRRVLSVIKDTPRNTSAVELLTGILDDIYTCNFSRLENVIVSGVHDLTDLSGTSWANFKTCTRSGVSKKECIQREEKLCRNASHIVTKVLRLTTYSLETLLQKHDNLKVIQLFRDPRAIVNSRLESKGYPSKNYDRNSFNLCTKMLTDYNGGIQLLKKFPNRFKFAFYEDIKINVTDRMQVLYDFVGMDMDIDELKKLNKVKINSPYHRTPSMSKVRVADNANWWRTFLPFVKCQKVQDNCKEVARQFNLTHFKSRADMTQFSFPAMILPNALRIKQN